jgi:hypothetical protein
MKWITVAFIVSCSLLFSGCVRYVEYIPVERRIDRGNHLLIENPALLTETHVEAMKRILDGYGRPYKVVEGRLYIQKSLQQDRDLLQNFTAKAISEETAGR